MLLNTQDPALASLVKSDKLPISVAEELLRIPDPQQRKALAKQAAREGWDNRQARAAAEGASADLVRAIPDARDAGRQVIALIRELHALLEVVPIDELPATAHNQLRVLWRDLAPAIGN